MIKIKWIKIRIKCIIIVTGIFSESSRACSCWHFARVSPGRIHCTWCGGTDLNRPPGWSSSGT